MKKTTLVLALASTLLADAASATTFDFSGTFKMYSGAGFVGGSTTPGSVTGTFNFDMATGSGSGGSMTSAVTFFGFTLDCTQLYNDRQP